MATLLRLESIEGETGIVRVALDNPKVNALGSQLLAQAMLTFEGLAANDAIRGVLLEARGSCFSAGLDLKEVASLSRDELTVFLESLDRCLLSVFTFPKPLACAVEGHAIAGGMILACAADHLVLGTRPFRVGLTEVALGVPFPRSAFEIARAALPPRALRAFVLQPELRLQDVAFQLGFGDAIAEQPSAAALEWLRQTAALPQEPFRQAKLAIRENGIDRIRQSTEAERSELVDVILSAETREAMARALGK